MKNTIIKYELEEFDENDIPIDGIRFVHDYNTKDVHFDDLYDEIKDIVTVYQVQNGDKLERISMELYGTPDYWDILLLLNKMDPLFDMPYDDGNVLTQAEIFVNVYQNTIYMNNPLVQSRTDELRDEIVEDVIEENKKRGIIYVVKSSRMGEFLLLATAKGLI